MASSERPRFRALDPRTCLFALAYLATTLTLTAAHVGPERFAKFWDDALFFRRVAHNLVHHGFAGWNVADGPVFVNTSQLFQLVSVPVLWLFPQHYNAAIVVLGALATAGAWALLFRATGALSVGAVALFCWMQAPPVILAVATGMETPVVLLAMSSVLLVLLRRAPSSTTLNWAIGLQLLAYLARPDALILSFVFALGLCRTGRECARFVLGTAVVLGLTSAGFYAYYGTPVPLATFLKLGPFSVYDAHYLSLGVPDKLKNLAQLGLLVLPLLPLFVARFDRVNRALLAAAAAFVAFQAFFTTEIAGYHARFYAPCLPFVFAAALRALPDATLAVHRRRLLVTAAFAFALFVFAFERGIIENEHGYGPDIVELSTYVLYFAGTPLAALGLGRAGVRQPFESALVVGALAMYRVVSWWPTTFGVVTDAVSDRKTVDSHRADVGIDVIQRCFPEPIRLMHSEIGLPSVMFPESHVFDFTGLSDPRVLEGAFDFEAICREERPEFVFRPHWTHERLNRMLDASACLRTQYEEVPLARPSSCPLYVRSDLVPRYLACDGR